MRCTGNSNLTSPAARHLHKEICAMLLEALEALKVSLSEFTTVLPQQWVSLMGNGSVATNGECFGQEQRLKKITEEALVSDFTMVQQGKVLVFVCRQFITSLSLSHSFWRLRTSSQPVPTQILHNCVPNAFSTGGRLSRLADRQAFTLYWRKSIKFCGYGDFLKVFL